jgi:ubiquinone/menaquinone biosynthesis C-methylase UbiE
MLRRIPSVHDPAIAFDAAADTYDDDPHHGRIADALVRGLHLTIPPALVVDVATGTGVAAFAALRLLVPERVVAVDLAPRMLDRAMAKAQHEDPDGRIDWRQAPAVPLDLGDDRADVVLCASSLHFLGAAALHDWLRVLRPGGRVAFSVPMAADFNPSPEFRRMVAGHLAIPSDAGAAAGIALGAGFVAARTETTAPASGDRPRRAFLVWAEAPAAPRL